MIIEFYGLSGSGKSTAARKLAAAGQIKLVKIENKFELLWYNFLFFINHPIKFIIRLSWVIKNSNSGKLFYYKLMNSFLNTNAKYQKALKYPVAVLDQGFIQNITSIFEKRVGREEIKKYLNCLVWPDKLIIFKASREVLESRKKGRGYGSREFLGQEYVKKWEEIVYDNYDVLLGLVKELPLRVCLIDAAKGREEVLQEVIKSVKND